LKEKLYRAFDAAFDRSQSPYANETNQLKAAKVAARIADAIVDVEARLDKRNEQKNGLRLPGK
jgi:hypothetical protein